MKKLLFLLISIPFIFSSCEQEDNTPQTSPPPNPIHGSWNLDSGVYYFVQGVIDQNNQEIILDGDTNFLPDNGLTYEWVISSNGTMTENYYQNNVLGQSETFNYTISNNTLINLDDSHHWTITNLTSNNLSCNNDIYVGGKLTVLGLIDPTGLVLDAQSTIPTGAAGTNKAVIWYDFLKDVL